MNGYITCFTAIITKGNKYCDFLIISLENEALQKKKSTLEGKNLLQGEQILSFKSWSQLRREVPKCK